MSPTIEERVESVRSGKNPTLICQVPSGWAVLCDTQFLPGYSILLPDPVVKDINALTREARSVYLCDMAMIGDALLEVTGAYRINYAILGNTDPALHAHIIPRYLGEPEAFRKGLPWSYSREYVEAHMFEYEHDKELIQRIAQAIKKRL